MEVASLGGLVTEGTNMFDDALVQSRGLMSSSFLVWGRRTEPPPKPRGTPCEYLDPESAVERLREEFWGWDFALLWSGIFDLMCEHDLWSDPGLHPDRERAFRILASALLEDLPSLHMVQEIHENRGTQLLVIPEIELP